jgi:hypothetical protein
MKYENVKLFDCQVINNKMSVKVEETLENDLHKKGLIEAGDYIMQRYKKYPIHLLKN